MCFFRSVAAGHNIPAAVKHEKTHQRAILLELDSSTVEMGWNIQSKFHEFSQKKTPLEAIMGWFHDQPGESQMYFVVLLNCSNKHALLPVSLSVPTWFRHLDHFLALRKWNWSRNSQEKCVAFGPKYPGLKDVRWVRYDGMPLGWSNIARAPFLYMNLAYRIYSVFTFLLAFRCVSLAFCKLNLMRENWVIHSGTGPPPKETASKDDQMPWGTHPENRSNLTCWKEKRIKVRKWANVPRLFGWFSRFR